MLVELFLFGIFAAATATVAAIAITVIVIAVISFVQNVLSFFQRLKHQRLLKSDAKRIAVSVREKLKNNKYRVINGIFDTQKNEFVRDNGELAIEVLEGEKLDKTAQDMYKKDVIVIKY